MQLNNYKQTLICDVIEQRYAGYQPRTAWYEKLQITQLKAKWCHLTYMTMCSCIFIIQEYWNYFKPYQIHWFAKQNIINSVYALSNQDIISQMLPHVRTKISGRHLRVNQKLLAPCKRNSFGRKCPQMSILMSTQMSLPDSSVKQIGE